MKILLTLAIVMLSIAGHAQTESTNISADTLKEFTTVQVEARFPGGAKGWQKYLEANLNSDLSTRYLKPKKGETITQQAIISFLVDTSGNISEVQILNPGEVHRKLAAESIRVIKEGPKWIPATQNGKKVIYRQKQTITWEVSSE
jgi:protein TonB